MNIEEQLRIRQNFINTLKDTAEIAEISGQLAAASVLNALIGAMLAVEENSLCEHVSVFSRCALDRIETGKQFPSTIN